MNKSLWLTASLIFLLVLSACSAQPTPTSTPLPTATPTRTPQPSAAVVSVELSLGTRLNVYDRFSFQVIESYPYNLASPGVFVGSLLQDIRITFVLFDGETDGLAEGENFLASLDQNFANYELGEPEDTQVNGFAGTTATVSASAGGFELDGRYVLVEFEDGDQFVGLALGDTSGGRDAWTLEGSSAFELMLDTVEFGPSEEVGSVCTVSTDPTYGYSLDNPIRVGGSSLSEFVIGGVDREIVYFENLRGPNGEPVFFERGGSLSSADTILDSFYLTSTGFSETRTLYIDMYNFEELFAPVGFTCGGRFTISAP